VGPFQSITLRPGWGQIRLPFLTSCSVIFAASLCSVFLAQLVVLSVTPEAVEFCLVLAQNTYVAL
jgi:hypothetical protein